MRPLALLTATLMLAGAAACSQGATTERAPGAPVVAPVVARAAAPEVVPAEGGDPARGKSLVARYECNRCHEGTGLPAPALDRQCVGCHDLVAAGKAPVPPAQRQAMQSATRHYLTTPGLGEVGRTVRAPWIARFLHEPVKVRTHEEEWMPRLAIPEDDARDIAAYLTAAAPALEEPASVGDASRGRELFSRKGCFLCHDFTGASRADVAPEIPPMAPEAFARAITQAPDLRLARERVRQDVIVRWIQDPRSVRDDALMPALGVSPDEARDLAAYVLTTPLAAPPPAPAPFERLPLLERRVTYEEVAARVFRKSCVHCHADPGKSGDPGPGSAGGFGFALRGVRLLSYEGTQLGYVANGGARRSLFEREPELERWGGSRLVASLVARHEEVAGRPLGEVRGMPMGLPPLAADEIQLVETWAAQGGPRN
jgi:cytochrome c2